MKAKENAGQQISPLIVPTQLHDKIPNNTSQDYSAPPEGNDNKEPPGPRGFKLGILGVDAPSCGFCRGLDN